MFPILGEQAAILKVTRRVASGAARVARAGRIVEFGGALVRYVRSVRLGLPVGFDAAKGFESFRAFKCAFRRRRQEQSLAPHRRADDQLRQVCEGTLAESGEPYSAPAR